MEQQPDTEKQYGTYILEFEGTVIIIENVPGRVCPETGEMLFAPETVARLQRIIWNKKKPVRFVQSPVYDFAREYDSVTG